jgi:hypothetical protein
MQIPIQTQEVQRLARRFLTLRADLSIRKRSIFFPRFNASTSQVGLAPRPAQVSPDGLRYFGGTFLPLNKLARPRVEITALILFNCFSISARCSSSLSSTSLRRFISPSTFIPDRFTLGMTASPMTKRKVLTALMVEAIASFTPDAGSRERQHQRKHRAQAADECIAYRKRSGAPNPQQAHGSPHANEHQCAERKSAD